MGNRKNEALVLKSPSRDPSYKRSQGNYPAKKYKKGQPCITRLSFEFTGSGTQFIDVAKALSAVNRRLYRQGCYYYVNSIEYYDNSDSFVDVHTLPDNWVTRAAYRRAKGIFDEMNDRAMHSSGVLLPKYHDFKVYMSSLHRTNGDSEPVLYGVNQVPGALSADDWSHSKMVSADSDGDIVTVGGVQQVNQEADDFDLHMLGDHVGSGDNWLSVGIIKSYADTRVRAPNDNPIVPADLQADPMFNLFDYSTEEQINDVISNLDIANDESPYDNDIFVGSGAENLHQVCRLTTTAEAGRVTMGAGFCAPLGLIAIDPPTAGEGPNTTGMDSDNLYRIVLNLAVGTYNGVYAERM